jgi:hypothetical protein
LVVTISASFCESTVLTSDLGWVNPIVWCSQKQQLGEDWVLRSARIWKLWVSQSLNFSQLVFIHRSLSESLVPTVSYSWNRIGHISFPRFLSIHPPYLS